MNPLLGKFDMTFQLPQQQRDGSFYYNIIKNFFKVVVVMWKHSWRNRDDIWMLKIQRIEL